MIPVIPTPSRDQFIAGSVGGIGQTLVSHPIDTIKTRMQLFDFKSPFDCLKTTVKQEGIPGLYKGMGAPLFGVALVNAIVFTSYGYAKSILNKDGLLYIKAGAFAGFINSFACSPIEMIKIRLQAQISQGLYTGPWNVIKTTISNHGLKGIYRGLHVTILKEIPACAGWYGGFEYAKQKLQDKEGNLSLLKLMVSGSIGGISYWTCCFPIDVVKVRIQQNPLGPTSIPYHLKQVHERYGIKGFYRGYSVSIVRAIPSSGNEV